MVNVRVPATSANMGPGFDSLGIAFKLYNEYSFEELEAGLVFEGVEEEFANKDNLIYKSMIATFKAYEYKYRGLKIKIINQQIPVSRGLGSSSSCIVAGIVGAMKLMNIKINKEKVLEIAVEIEGHPDNVCPAIYGGMVTAIMNEEIPIYNEVIIKDGVKFIALIPNFKLSTTKARAVLPEEVTLKDAVFNVSRAALLVSAFSNGKYELLKYALEDRLHQGYRSALIDGFDELYEESLKLGALGCFLSGAGPTMMTVIDINNTNFKEEIEKFINKNNLRYKTVELLIDKDGVVVF